MSATPLLRVLVVEDEALLAMDMEETIEECGHIVAGEARCLHSAEALADSVAPDLAFVDIQLARSTSGLDVSKMIQRRWPAAMIVFVTANPTQVPQDFGGAHGLICKPLSHSGLVSTMKFLAQGISDPPPRLARPPCISLSGVVEQRWLI